MIFYFTLAIPFCGVLFMGTLVTLCGILLFITREKVVAVPVACAECVECAQSLVVDWNVILDGLVKILISIICGLLASYAMYAHTKPVLTTSSNEKMKRILFRCRRLQEGFWPTMWATSGHSQSCLFGLFPGWRLLLRLRDPIQYDREYLAMEDGGNIALDWAIERPEPQAPQYNRDDERPILFLTCGVVGNSGNAYISQLVDDIRRTKGYRCVVKSWRGFGSIELTDHAQRPECWDAEVTVRDTLTCIQHVHAKYPKAPILACGFSVGAHMLTLTFGRHGDTVKACNVRALICLSGPNNYEITMSRMQHLKPLPYDWVNMGVVWHEFHRYISPSGKGDDISKSAWADTVGVERLTEFYNIMMHRTSSKAIVNDFCPLSGWLWHKFITLSYTGHDTVEAYTRHGNALALRALRRIPVPTLLLHAEDDPIVPPEAQWEYMEALRRSNNGLVVQCKKGGHCGFFEGLLGDSWITKISAEFFEAVLHET